VRDLVKAVLVAAAVFTGIAGLEAPAPATNRETHTILVWVVPSDSLQTPSRVLVTGSFTDFGDSLRANARGQSDSRGSYTLLVLQQGSIVVAGPALSPSAVTSGPRRRLGTCSVSTTSNERMPVLRGTQAYTGIRGTIMVSVSSVLILPLETGGKCMTGSRAIPLASWSTITGTGTVTIPSPKH
jgi:hypothetical protein